MTREPKTVVGLSLPEVVLIVTALNEAADRFLTIAKDNTFPGETRSLLADAAGVRFRLSSRISAAAEETR
jgi:hypothetical protein